MSSILKEAPVYKTMLDNNFIDDKNQLSYAFRLHRCMHELRNDPKGLLEFCEAVMTKASEVQLFLGQIVAKAETQMSPELIAQYTLFAQQLLTLYQVASQMYMNIPTPRLGGRR